MAFTQGTGQLFGQGLRHFVVYDQNTAVLVGFLHYSLVTDPRVSKLFLFLHSALIVIISWLRFYCFKSTNSSHLRKHIVPF